MFQPHDVTLSNKSYDKRGGKGEHSLWRCLSPRKITMHNKALLPRKCLDTACWRKRITIFIILCLWTHPLAFSIKLLLSWLKSFSCDFPPIWRGGVREHFGVHLTARVNPPHCLFKKHLHKKIYILFNSFLYIVTFLCVVGVTGE